MVSNLPQTGEPTIEHFDVLVIGAGLSGIGAAYHLQTRCPEKRYAILEARSTIGGTWDLFRYPGVRSDSDMYTLGYRFRPWLAGKAIADGPSILRYIRDTASDYGIDRHIRFGHRMTRAEWSSNDGVWTVTTSVTADAATRATSRAAHEGANLADDDMIANGNSAPAVARFTCNLLYTCTGYYDYKSGYTPDFDGIGEFGGPVIHPQQWPEDLDYAGKRVLVIGSGATAVTLVPAMATTAAHVTMLQRSPGYVVARPSSDSIANAMRRVLPPRAAYAAVRWKNVLLSSFWYRVARRYPAFMKRTIKSRAQAMLGDSVDAETHFNPRYKPWDERLCLAPDADLFNALKSGNASVVTDEVARFTSTGVRLRSGAHIDADIVVTATGLNMRLLSDVQLVVDGRNVELPKTLAYKGMMLSDVPNLVSAFGYTNASWTLKCDLTADYACRLLQYMDQHGFRQCTPRRNDPMVSELPVLDFTSGYVQRALDGLPRQGSRTPWKLHQNYPRDLMMLRFGKLDDGVLEFA